MEVYGQLKVAGFERLTSDPTGAQLFAGRAWYRTDLQRFKVYDGTAVQTFVDEVGAQTLQNKILAGANISDYIEFDEVATPSNPAANKHRIYFKADGTPYTLDSSGNEQPLGSGGGGSKNYFSDVDASIDSTVGNWLTDDGVGGASAGLTLSVTAVAGELLAGTNSLKLVKDAANRDGHFIKVQSETIDPADRGRANFGSFEFRPGTGYVSGDLIFEVYDVTNAAVLYSGVAADLELLNSRGRFNWVTYLEETTAQVEFRVKVNNTNTNGFDVFFDAFTFGPAAILASPIVTEWQEFPMSITGTTTDPTPNPASEQANWRRVGDSMQITYNLLQSAAGSAGSGTYEFSLPPGYQIDGSKWYTGIGNGAQGACGNVIIQSTSRGIQHGYAIPVTTTKFYLYTGDAADNPTPMSSAYNPFSDTDIRVSFMVTVPIQGWGSGAVLKTNELSLQTITAKYVVTGSSANLSFADATFEAVDFDSKVYDSHNAVTTGASWVFTAPRSSIYEVNVQTDWDNVSGLNRSILRFNTSAGEVRNIADGDTDVMLGASFQVRLEKGQTLAAQLWQDDSGGSARNLATDGHNVISIRSVEDFTVLGAVKNEEYLETVYTDSTGDINNANYVSPGPSEFALPLTEGTWDVGYSISVALESLGGTGRVDMAAALHLDGSFISDTEGYVMANGNATSDGNIMNISNTTRITLTSPQDLQLRVAAAPAASMRSRMVSVGWTASINGDDTAPKLWARRVK